MRIEIEVVERDPPSGRVWSSGGGPVAFEGWLGLLKVLSETLEHHPDGP